MMAPAAAQHRVSADGGALNHLAPVVDPLSGRLANPNWQQVARVRRWVMDVPVMGRGYAGAKSLLSLIGIAMVGDFCLLPFAGVLMKTQPVSYGEYFLD